jgi:hypothetical protein
MDFKLLMKFNLIMWRRRGFKIKFFIDHFIDNFAKIPDFRI